MTKIVVTLTQELGKSNQFLFILTAKIRLFVEHLQHGNVVSAISGCHPAQHFLANGLVVLQHASHRHFGIVVDSETCWHAATRETFVIA